jgi:putative toxin-antitoxin system antitoxin component (TIGR02293 family)
MDDYPFPETLMSTYPDVARVAEQLGGRRLLKERVATVADMERVVGKGLPYASLAHVVRGYPERQQRHITDIVVPRSTLQRRSEEGRLKPAESERLERIVRLTTLAEQAWESRAEAQQFLTAPHPMLDGHAPLDLAATDLGTRRVEALLWKLEYSLPV